MLYAFKEVHIRDVRSMSVIPFSNVPFSNVIHPEESVFIPLEKMIFWGFIIDSVRMIVMLTEDKIHKLKDLLIFPMDNAHSLRIRDIARLIGHLVWVYQLSNMAHSNKGTWKWIALMLSHVPREIFMHTWLPQRKVSLKCNGGYATYMGALIPFAIPKLM